MRVECRLVSRLDTNEWTRQYDLGMVPDRVPYGLDRIAHYGFGVRVARAPLVIRRVVGRLQSAFKSPHDWASAGQARRGDALLCWDERTGVPAAWSSRGPVFTGVIWATEQPGSRVVAGALRRSAGVFTLSTAQIPVLERWGVKDPEYIAMGVDTSFFVPDSDRREVMRTVLTVGNDRHRDFDTVISAHRMMQDPKPDLCIVSRRRIAETGPGVSMMSAMSHPDLVSRYQRAAVVVVGLRPNLHVSGITTTLEAMACARPVVVSDTPGMRDYVDDGRTGLLVPVGDATATANAVADLIAAPDEAAAMGRRARLAVEGEFSTEHQAHRLATWIHSRL